MPRRALLIGAPHGDLEGVGNDVDAMDLALRRHGFTSTRIADGATRERILAAYEALIAETEATDAVVVYYSGHGGRTPAPDPGGFDLQYLVPDDFDQSTDADFRGITSVELSVLQSRLAERAANVTVVLDCCYAGRMSRHPGQRLKAGPRAPYERVRAHLERLAAAGLQVDRWRNEGHPDVVRLVACSPRGPAFERVSEARGSMGVFTDGLTAALAEAGEATGITWAAIMDRVRHRMADRSYEQRPDVEGPADRLLFSAQDADLFMSLPVVPLGDAGKVRLDCAPLLGVHRGDRFVVMPPGAGGPAGSAPLGELTVTGVEPLWAVGRVAAAAGQVGGSALVGARAYRTHAHAPQIRVRAPLGDPGATDLLATLADLPLVEVVGPDGPDWVGTVDVAPDGALTVGDRWGPLHPPRAAGRAGIEQVRRDLKILAQATQLRRLVGVARGRLSARLDVEWGVVVGGAARPLAPDDPVAPGDWIYARIRNDGTAVVFVSIVDIGVTGRITVLTKGAPSGWELRRGEHYTFGEDRRTGRLTGAPVSLPEGVDVALTRPETLLVVVTSAPQDLRALEQPGVAQAHRSRRPGRSPLQDLIDQLGTERRTRDVAPEDLDDVVSFDVHAITFDLVAS